MLGGLEAQRRTKVAEQKRTRQTFIIVHFSRLISHHRRKTDDREHQKDHRHRLIRSRVKVLFERPPIAFNVD